MGKASKKLKRQALKNSAANNGEKYKQAEELLQRAANLMDTGMVADAMDIYENMLRHRVKMSKEQQTQLADTLEYFAVYSAKRLIDGYPNVWSFAKPIAERAKLKPKAKPQAQPIKPPEKPHEQPQETAPAENAAPSFVVPKDDDDDGEMQTLLSKLKKLADKNGA